MKNGFKELATPLDRLIIIKTDGSILVDMNIDNEYSTDFDIKSLQYASRHLLFTESTTNNLWQYETSF